MRKKHGTKKILSRLDDILEILLIIQFLTFPPGSGRDGKARGRFADAKSGNTNCWHYGKITSHS